MELEEVLNEWEEFLKLYEETDRRLNGFLSKNDIGLDKNEIINLSVNDFIDTNEELNNLE